MSDRPKPYPEVSPHPNLPEIEERILRFWKEQDIFRKSVENRPAGERGENEYVFYDGPPFANGLPHYGHLVTGYVKDVVPRYQTMRGRRVERRFGWDCHGLPAELEAERELGLHGREEILAYGIDRFNDFCRRSVLKYTREWEAIVTRQARWVDFENDYRTMDPDYMESVLWAFKTLYERDLVYEGTRVLPYSWAAETPVSNFETRLDDSYRERRDPAVTVSLELEPAEGDPGPMELWIWTTTPWTLPSNLAVAVGPDLDYRLFEKDGRYVVIGAQAVSRYEPELEGARPAGALKGRELVGRRYRPLFPFFTGVPGAFRVLAGDFVGVDEGTGVVHLAPGFGEEDHELCLRHGIPVVCPVDEKGRFTAEVAPWAGKNVFEANDAIIEHLVRSGRLVRKEIYVHNYPHCWRTDTPLIYRAMSSWFVRVSAFNQRMVELNRLIRWIPEHVRDGQMGKWLEGARDWSISRNRFWGAPIPVWKSDDPEHPRVEVYGSLEEIERAFGRRPKDLHRPYIDELVRPNPDDPTGRSKMRRVEDVLDCWFESGSMPFAQVHYPFENADWFESHFPADFIVEYIAQTRGWFYTLIVLATSLFDRHPFRNCICHGVVLDENGQKLSKRLRNYPNPQEVFDTYGADALRWFLISSPILRGHNLQIDREGRVFADTVRQAILPIWNAYAFFTLYANLDGFRAEVRTDVDSPLDRYLLAKTRRLVEDVTAAMEDYDIPLACQHIQAFTDALNNWYIRRSRERFWRHALDEDKRAAYCALYTSLETFMRTAAPFLPLVTEEIYRGLTGRLSVHLEDWPEPEALPDDAELVETMDLAREVCSAALALRKARGVRVRQPLRRLTVAGPGAERLALVADLVRDEVNVKEVDLSDDAGRLGEFSLRLEAARVGKRLRERAQEVFRGAREGNWRRREDGRVEVAGVVLEPGEFEFQLRPRAGVDAQAVSGTGLIVSLDFELTPELVEEGIVRDVVRLVQQARKEAGLEVVDRIELSLYAPGEIQRALLRHRDWIAEQTLARAVRFEVPEPHAHQTIGKVQGQPITIGLVKVERERAKER